jgi:hypothetical protein
MKTALLMVSMAAAALGQPRGNVPFPAPGNVPLPLPAAGNVTLPLDEYDRLIEMASKPPKRDAKPPLAYAIQSAEIKLEAKGDTVSGSMQLEGEVLATGITVVPLVTGLTVLDAQQQGKALPVLQEGGIHAAILSGPARFSVMLRIGMPVTIEPGSASFALPVPPAGAVRVTLVIPGESTNVNLSSGLITSRKSDSGRTMVEAILAPGQPPATFRWATRETAPPPAPREVRFLSDVKTLVSVGEAQIGVAALIDLTVVQGEPSQFEMAVPEGYEVTGVTGASLDSSDTEQGVLVLKIPAGTERSHQFLISMEKAMNATKADVPMLSLKGTQRETGEVLIEGEGTMELSAKDAGGLQRMDQRETSPYLRALARNSLQAAFRYHRQPGETPAAALEWVRFPDSSLLAAVAQEATVTTLVTTEGKSLTEVRLTVRNQAQPFLKLGLPAGASILSADVAGEKVKPVQAPDGLRVPLLKPGFHPAGAYPVSFVFLHSGAPFAKKGGAELSLPGMDIPVGLLNWEVFLPAQYKVRDFGGDALRAGLVPPATQEAGDEEVAAELAIPPPPPPASAPPGGAVDLASLLPGQLGGHVHDPTGAAVSTAHVTVVDMATGVTRTANVDLAGRWVVSNVPAGRVRITAAAQGFRNAVQDIYYDPSRPSLYNLVLQVGALTETVEVSSGAPSVENYNRDQSKKDAAAQSAPSVNVMNLQQRVAGVLPIRVDVPHEGASYRFVRPLVTDEETKVTFTYKKR